MSTLLACLFWLQTAPAPVLAIEHVSVLPMDSETVLADRTVIVADGRITALGPGSEIPVPEGAQRIDGRERFLMPGLADMHVHVLDENDLYLFVANGVTTIRNMFGAPGYLDWRARIESGELVGPRIYTAGPIIDGHPPVWPGSVELTDPERAAALVREQKEAGYDFLKPYAMLTPECYRALAAAGADQGMRLMGHVPDALRVDDVLAADQTTIEHLGGIAEAAQRAGSPWKEVDYTTESRAWKEVDDERLAAVAGSMRAAGVWSCPTLVVMQKWAQGEAADALFARPEMRYLSPLMRNAWRPRSPFNYLSNVPASFVQAAHDALPFQLLAVRALRDAGAPLLLGTDMGNPYVMPGFAVHEELGYLVEAGLTAYEALRAGTAEAARCMGAAEDWGTLVVGRRADLLLLAANPLEDVRHAAQRVGVVLHGRWLSEEELQAGLERRAAAFEEEAKR